jgi:hypothetical protein
MKNSRRLCNIAFFSAALGLGTGVLAQDKPGCLDGICVNESVATLPKNIAWTPLDPQTLRSYYTPGTKDAGEKPFAAKRVADGAVIAQKIYPGQGVDYAKLGNSMGLQNGGFDGSLLPTLGKLSMACKAQTWTGSFTNAQGLVTEVVLMMYPAESSPGAQPNSLRIQRVTRYFPNVAMGSELAALRESLQGVINMPINDKTRSEKDLSPTASVSRSPALGAAILEILDMPLGRFDYRKLEQQAACKN